jgi:hypothetical protein
VKPLSRGGLNTWDNVVAACTKCNARKGNRLPMECGMYPKTTPKEPRYVVMVWYSRGLNAVQRRYVEQFYGDGSLTALSSRVVGLAISKIVRATAVRTG